MGSNKQFLLNNPENADYNQYWYSKNTIKTITEELINLGGRIAFISTPSLFFSLPDENRLEAVLLDFDRKWENCNGFVFYDFNLPDSIEEGLFNKFDVVVIDPPFITEEVWLKYSITAKFLLRKNEATNAICGKVILTTINENSRILFEMFGASPTKFLPSIPNLVYQYNLFTNYESNIFSEINPEIPE